MSYPGPDDFDDGTYLWVSAAMVVGTVLFWITFGHVYG